MVEECVDGTAERDVADGRGVVRGLHTETESFDRGLGEERDLVDFFEIVVLGGEPEDGNVFNACRRSCLFRAGDCSGGFEQGEQRASEQADLLAGHDGSCSGAEFCDVGECGGTGSEGEALTFECIGKSGGVGGRSGGLHPCAAERLGSVPVAQRSVGSAVAHCEEVAEEPGGVQQRRDGVTLSAHPQSLGT